MEIINRLQAKSPAQDKETRMVATRRGEKRSHQTPARDTSSRFQFDSDMGKCSQNARSSPLSKGGFTQSDDDRILHQNYLHMRLNKRGVLKADMIRNSGAAMPCLSRTMPSRATSAKFVPNYNRNSRSIDVSHAKLERKSPFKPAPPGLPGITDIL